jgi:hypothetical protein
MPALNIDYEYDVFFSYKRHDMTLDWSRRVHRLLQYWLSQEIHDREVRMFVDEDQIEAGDIWPERLKDALKRSRCMVCVWSPSYFRSDWCYSEWQTFRKREELTNQNSHGLIVPMRFHDGDHFPEEARNIQWIDVAPYNSTLSAFWSSERALELEELLKKVARTVAARIVFAPPFDATWPVVEVKAPTLLKIGLARL